MAKPACRQYPRIPIRPTRAIEHLRASDPRMAHAIDVVGASFPLPQRVPTLHLLCSSIIGQSISVRAAEVIVGRFSDRVGTAETLTPKKIMGRPVDELREIGVTRTKAQAMHDLAALWQREKWSPESFRHVGDDELIANMTTVKGIGPWTVKMFLIFGLRRPDVLPHEDLGLREGMLRLYGLSARPGKAETERIASAWGPWRTIGTVYAWQYLMKQSQQSLNGENGWW